MKRYNHEQDPPKWLVGEDHKSHTTWILDLEKGQIVQVEHFIYDTDGPLRILPCIGTDFERIIGYIRRVRSHMIEREKKLGQIGDGGLQGAEKWANEDPTYGAPATLPPAGLYGVVPSDDPLYDELGLGDFDEEGFPWWHVDPAHTPFKILPMWGNPDEVAPFCAGEWINGKLEEVDHDVMMRAIFSV